MTHSAYQWRKYLQRIIDHNRRSVSTYSGAFVPWYVSPEERQRIIAALDSDEKRDTPKEPTP